jgi:hypothetical protein
VTYSNLRPQNPQNWKPLDFTPTFSKMLKKRRFGKTKVFWKCNTGKMKQTTNPEQVCNTVWLYLSIKNILVKI